MELPIDHFRLLGVSPAIDAQSVLRTLEQRLDRSPDEGFTAEALEARAQLLRESADLLSDDRRRERYPAELTAVTADDSGVIPALMIASAREVGGLILLWEAGLGAHAFELASR
ncbi:MAG: molecular chaperone DnaJ, partial [Cyanobacteriota bacterium]